MHVSFWGVRGSIPVADHATLGYGGNTSCVAVRLRDGSLLVLDGGTGIRDLGVTLAGVREEIHILLTHLQLDHIMGLLFFAPLFDSESRVTLWGPPHQTAGIRHRLARYLSAPLCPIEIRELPARVQFRSVPSGPVRLGSAKIGDPGRVFLAREHDVLELSTANAERRRLSSSDNAPLRRSPLALA